MSDTNKQTVVAGSQPQQPPQSATSTAFPVRPGSQAKEQEPLSVVSAETVQEVKTEIELPPEIEKVGVMKVGETFEVPPDVRKLGVSPSGPTTAVSATSLPPVILPISDRQVVVGLHTHIGNALRWLAVWCIKKLKKAHVMLKVIHGKIVRVRQNA